MIAKPIRTDEFRPLTYPETRAIAIVAKEENTLSLYTQTFPVEDGYVYTVDDSDLDKAKYLERSRKWNNNGVREALDIRRTSFNQVGKNNDGMKKTVSHVPDTGVVVIHYYSDSRYKVNPKLVATVLTQND